MNGRIVVGMSGGVDSSVAALLLRDQGFDVEALFMKNWNEATGDGSCVWETDVQDAMEVCEKLDIRINTVDLSQEYWREVFTSFLEAYRGGRTPNPDVLCNQEIKFKAFLSHAIGRGADRIATGHYARIADRGGKPALLKGRDRNKDQSYFLCRLSREQLQCAVFPIGDLAKPRVRALAERAGLKTHAKKDSTGLCFVGERDFREFLARFLPVEPGEIRDAAGAVLGEHEGTHFYTIGQRQGLKIGGVSGRGEGAWFVAAKDPATNVLTVVQGHDHPLLYTRRVLAREPHWLAGPSSAPFRCAAKIRYRQPDQSCVVESLPDGRLALTFDQPQRAVAAGQYAVLYDGDLCLGSAVIA